MIASIVVLDVLNIEEGVMTDLVEEVAVAIELCDNPWVKAELKDMLK